MPQLAVNIYQSMATDDLEKAWEAQSHLIPLRLCFNLGIVSDPVKEAARAIRLIDGAGYGTLRSDER